MPLVPSVKPNGNKFIASLQKWWVPVLFWGFTFILYNAGELANIAFVKSFSFYLLIIGLLTLFVSMIFQFYKRKWLGGIISLIAFGGTFLFFVIVSIIMFASNLIDGDHWADDLKIPDNIPLNEPIDLPENGKRPDSILNLSKKSPDFYLYNSFQPGLYCYDFWAPSLDRGTIYLKAYEITQNYQLSQKSLPEASAIRLEERIQGIARFGTAQHFTIYEGDWGKPYAARFEVWFRPTNGAAEQKLFEKNYKIEGWMH